MSASSDSVVDCSDGSGADCLIPNDRSSYDVWLSVKSTVDGSGSIMIYSYEEQECVAAKVVLQTSRIGSSLSAQHHCLYFVDFCTAVGEFFSIPFYLSFSFILILAFADFNEYFWVYSSQDSTIC